MEGLSAVQGRIGEIQARMSTFAAMGRATPAWQSAADAAGLFLLGLDADTMPVPT